MKMSFIIPAYNEEHFLGPCLESLQKEIEKYGSDLQTEIIVVNNASQDRTREVALAFSGVKVYDETRKGTGFARQRGFEEAQGEYLAYLDSDMRLPGGWLKKGRTLFEQNPKAVLVSGAYRYYDASFFERFLLESLWWLTVPLASFCTGSVVMAGNFIVKREALAKIGGFDTRITFYGDDTDLGRRIRRVGKVVFRMDFFVFSSYRRYAKLGLVRTLTLYVMNFFWEILFARPFTVE